MASDTDVVNIALRKLGAARITSLTDGSKNANVANDIYSFLRDDLLRSSPWNFATKRQQLSRSATAPAFEFDYAYPLPSDWLRTISVHDNDQGHGTVFYRMEEVDSQRCIVTSADEIYLRYIYQATDPNMWTADFREAFACALARDMALSIPSSNTDQQIYEKAAERALSRARSQDALGGFPEVRPRGSWVGVRSGWRFDGWGEND